MTGRATWLADRDSHAHRTGSARTRATRGWSSGLLWFCGFFNYADRQAVYSVFPLLKTEFGLSNDAARLLGSAFMFVYALASPFSGYMVDLLLAPAADHAGADVLEPDLRGHGPVAELRPADLLPGGRGAG